MRSARFCDFCTFVPIGTRCEKSCRVRDSRTGNVYTGKEYNKIERRYARQRYCRRAALTDGKQSFVEKIAQSDSDYGQPR